MSLLSRHILRSLVAPFFWGVIALTGLLLLNTLSSLIDRLGGKGLEWQVMAEAIILAIPALLVLTIPMAVLTATLYGFGQLAADAEMVAMYANGVSVWRMARPALLAATGAALVNFLFFDQVIPNSNARLRGLMIDVGNKHPTLALRAGELTRIGTTSPYVMLAQQVDSGGIVRDVTIYTLSSADARQVIRADSGHLQIAPNGRDMLMTLHHGSAIDYRPQLQGRVEHTTFLSDQIRLRDVTNQLQRTQEFDRGDREMGSCQLLDMIQDQSWYIQDGTGHRETATRRDLRRLAGLPATTRPPIQGKPPVTPHCGPYRMVERWFQKLLLPVATLDALRADSIQSAERYQRSQDEIARQRQRTEEASRTDEAARVAFPTPQGIPSADPVPPSDTTPPPVPIDSLRPTVIDTQSVIGLPDSLMPPPPDSGAALPDSLQGALLPDSTRLPDSLQTRPDSITLGADTLRADTMTALGARTDSARPIAPPPVTTQQPLSEAPVEPDPTAGMLPGDPFIAGLPQGVMGRPGDLPRSSAPRHPLEPLTTLIEVQGARQEVRGAEAIIATFRVEFHKKFAIPLASICFVLIGLALALRYPRGGIGLVIGGSLVVFMIFYILLSLGENLARKGFVSAPLAVHAPLVLFSVLGLLAVHSANQEIGSSRSSDILGPLRDLFRLRRRSTP